MLKRMGDLAQLTIALPKWMPAKQTLRPWQLTISLAWAVHFYKLGPSFGGCNTSNSDVKKMGNDRAVSYKTCELREEEKCLLNANFFFLVQCTCLWHPQGNRDWERETDGQRQRETDRQRDWERMIEKENLQVTLPLVEIKLLPEPFFSSHTTHWHTHTHTHTLGTHTHTHTHTHTCTPVLWTGWAHTVIDRQTL